MSFSVVVLLLVFSCLFTSCIKFEEVEPENFDYAGSWNSTHCYLEIRLNGEGAFSCPRARHRNGSVEITPDEIIFKSYNFDNRVFRIDVPPSVDSLGQDFMVLDSIMYYKH